MILAGAAALLAYALATAQEAPPVARNPPAIVRQQFIIRVQTGPRIATPRGAAPVRWREGRAPNCVSAARIAGATLLAQDSVDLLLRDGTRLRAHLEQRCPALDYYYGFYVSATEDGRICAERDLVRSRAGGQCRINRFRTLTPVRD